VVEAGDVGVERPLHVRVVEVGLHVIIRARIKALDLQQPPPHIMSRKIQATSLLVVDAIASTAC